MVKLPDDVKILVLDIEWKPTLAYVWGAFKVFVHPEQVKEDGGLLCVGAKWVGQNEVYLFSEWEHTHEGMLALTHELMSEADVIVGFNSDKYDIRKLEGEFLLYGFTPPPPVTSIDCIKTVKKLGFFMNRLAFVGQFLGIGKKMEHEGFMLWRKIIENNDERAQRRMARYCKQDVRLTEKLYLKIRPYIRNHPYLGKTKSGECPACGGKHSHSRGTVRTRLFQKQRLVCQGCGHWFFGRQSKIV